jgi:hypothetical protein
VSRKIAVASRPSVLIAAAHAVSVKVPLKIRNSPTKPLRPAVRAMRTP